MSEREVANVKNNSEKSFLSEGKENDFAIVAKDIYKSFGKKEVLKGVDFKVKNGSIFALLGSNGAGKTTMIKILTTLFCADKGEALVGGFDVDKSGNDIRKIISLTGQNVAVDDILSGRENLELIARLRRMKNPEEKINALLEKFELSSDADKRIAFYSGGMRRKLDLAMGLLGNPKIIFLDEPTVGLDPQSRISLWNIIRELAAEGVTVFLTTQYLEEAESLADEIAILHDGRIVANDTPSGLKALIKEEEVILEFADMANFEKAQTRLSSYNMKSDEDNLTIGVKYNDGIRGVSKLLEVLTANEIEISKFSTKQTTVEDVFLSIVNEKEGEVA